MFFEQLSEVLKSRHMQADFLCCERFRDMLTSEEKRIFGAIHFERAGNFLLGYKKLKAQILSCIPRYAAKIEAYKKISSLRRTRFDVLMNLNITSSVEMYLFNELKAAQKFTTKNPSNGTMYPPCDRNVAVSYGAFILNLYRDILSEYFNAPFSIPRLSLPFSKEQSLRTAVDAVGEHEYICFVPFTSSPARNWPIRNFAFIAKELYKRTRLKIIILGNGRKEATPEGIGNDSNVVNLINKTSLKQAMHIAATAKHTIACDTSLMHCALMGGSNCICVSRGDGNKLFVEYPKEYNAKQTIIYPESFDSTIGVHHSNLDINLITPQMVLDKIDEAWQL
jgi:ADP-heptose:LPS heptosyltransferase